ncbi:MAG: hypothetical protein QOE58_3175, partial [Actinomycetota bacterium]|nr:hypothetical protein [Actinomycetota bacterium]
LGSMAAEQESLLRALVSNVSNPVMTDGPDLDAVARGDVDLRSVLGQYAEGGVTVASPGEPVFMPCVVADELAAAVRAALDNVRRHAGVDAQAWILIEDKGRDVTVTIRDNGVGVPAGRLSEAATNGRMGVSNSIQGRMVDLGGSVSFDSRPGEGTCLELTVAKKGRVS